LVFGTDGGESLAFAIRERESHNYCVFDIEFSVYVVLKKKKAVQVL
jgi:hypothetical protein